MVDPEGHPGQHHDQNRRQIRLKDEVTDVPLQFEAYGQPLVISCTKTEIRNGVCARSFKAGMLNLYVAFINYILTR